MNTKTLLLVAGLGFAVLLFGKMQAAKRLQALLTNVRMNGGRLQIEFTVQNGLGFPVMINSIIGQVFANGSPVANVSHFGKTVLGANSATKFWIDVQLNVLGTAMFIKNALGTKLSFTAGFSGTLRGDGVVIDVVNEVKMF